MSSNNPEAATSPSTSNDPHQHYDGRGWGDEEEEKQEEEYEDDDEDDDDDRLVSIAVTPRHHVGVDVVGDRGDIGGGCDLGDDDDGGVGELGLDDEVGDVKSGGGDGDVKRDVVGKGGGVDFNDKDELLFGRKDEIEVREFEEYLEVEGMFVGFPVLIPRDYDLPTRWAEDVVVLMHNAVRREVSDLYEIMSAISMRYRLLTYKDIWALRQWWYLFLHFWEICNRADKEILFPLVSRSFEVSGRMMQFRKKFRYLGEVLDWLNFKLEEITAYVQALGKLPSGKVMALLFKAVKEFTPKMLKYFGMQNAKFTVLRKMMLFIRKKICYADQTFFYVLVCFFCRF